MEGALRPEDGGVPEWEKCKENVQPRKQGRCIGSLNSGLVAKTEPEVAIKLKDEKGRFESVLRSYEGDDPLSVWWEYIIWTEQNFPSGGKMSQLEELLKGCIKYFSKETRYKNDERYVKIWIKFANGCQDPLEIFKHMDSNTIGSKSAAFYKAWALCCEELGQTKSADRIYTKGLEAAANPLEALKKSREEFETRTCRRLLQTAESTDDKVSTETTRQSLVSLSASNEGQVPHDRVSSARPHHRAILSQNVRKPQSIMSIFTDENSTESVPDKDMCKKGQYTSLPDRQHHKENIHTAGRWSESARKSSSRVATKSMHADFEVHLDSKDIPLTTPSKTACIGVSHGLSVKKADRKGEISGVNALKTHIILPDPGDLTKEIPQYNKTKVYAGLSEFSFEELRAMKWKQDQEKRRLEKESSDAIIKCQQNLDEQRTVLDKQRAQIQLYSTECDVKMDTIRSDLERMLKEGMTHIEDRFRKLFENRIQTLERHGVRLDSRNLTTAASSDHSNEQIGNLSQPSKKYAQEVQDNEGSRTPEFKNTMKTVSCKRHRTPDTSCAKRSLITDSPWGMTQDCNKLMNGLFSQTLSAENGLHIPPSPEQPQSGEPPCYEPNGLASDTDEVQSALSVVRREASPAPFSVFGDEDTTSNTNTASNSNLCSVPNQIGLSATSQQQSQSVNNSDASATALSGSVEVESSSGHPAANFVVFSDENNFQTHKKPSHEPQESLPLSSAFTVYSDRKKLVQSDDKENVGVLPDNSKQSEPMEYHTDFDLKSQFSEHARAMSTPFHADNNPNLSEIAISEIKQTRTTTHRKSVQPIEFAPTQVLSPICEQSRESTSDSSSRNATSSASCSNIGVTKISFDTTRCRSTSSSSDNNEHVITENHPSSTDSLSITGIDNNKSKHGGTLNNPNPPLDKVLEESVDLLQKATPVIDTTYYKAPELAEAQLNTTIFIDPSNPFSESVLAKILRKINISGYDQVSQLDEPMPKLKVGSRLQVQDVGIKLTAKLGVGGFATAFKAVVTDAPAAKSSLSATNTTDILDGSKLNLTCYQEYDEICVKLQRPACPWELYICRELRDRLQYLDYDISRDVLNRIMNVTHANFFVDGSLMLNELVPFGSILNLVNAIKCKRMRLDEALVMYITIELLHTIEVLHRCKIIHGDFKPDNVLFMGFPTIDEDNYFATTSVKLIDFGRGIDMCKFAEGTTFTASNETEGFICIEMKTEQPWTYQTDLFGLLGTVYTLLFLDYMQVVYRNGKWQPHQMKMSRNFRSSLWQPMFECFLNIPSCDELPDITQWREDFEREFTQMKEEYLASASKTNTLIGITKL